MPETTTFGAKLKQRRKDLDLTQAELARRVGCTPSTIRMIELGQRRASKQMALLLADHLRIASAEQEGFLHAARALPGSKPVTSEPPMPTAPQTPPDLPQYLTPLIGRETELAALEERMINPDKRGSVRLLTLNGPAGVGKTRLAITLAERLQSKFADGVYFVSLAPISAPERMLAAIAAALDVQSASASALLKALTQRLSGKHSLLVLDNMEQIIAAGPDIAALLAASSTIKVLVTSREPLHVRGEHVFPVAPLALPDPVYFPPLAALPGYSALALFMERAQEAQPSFTLSARNAKAIAAICSRLDGLPLAIELVAARMAHFSPNAALTKLVGTAQEAFQLLDDGSRDLPQRQQSLHAAISWSFDLLSAQERSLFVRLAVFVGGCTLGALEDVCIASGDTNSAALALTTSLLRKSLLTRDASANDEDEPRFLLLETLREYAMVQLAALGLEAVDHARQRHAQHYLDLAEAAEKGIVGNEQARWVQRLARDHNNIQAALSWFLARGEAEQAARLTAAMTDFWIAHTHPEALRWLLLVLEHRPRISASLQNKTLRAATILAHGSGNLPLAQQLAAENLAVAEQLGDKAAVMKAHLRVGAVAVESDRFAQAGLSYRESLRLAQELGDILTELGANNALGDMARAQGDYAQAAAFFETNINLTQAAGSAWAIAVNKHNLGKALLQMGALTAAENHLRQSLEIFQNLGSQGGIAYCLSGLGAATLQQDKPQRAVTLLGAAYALLQRAGIVLERVDRAEYESALAQARLQLTTTTFQYVWDEGQHMPLEQLLEFALETQE